MKERRRNGYKNICKRSKGFTLVELIVVLVIIAILAALAIPAVLGFIDNAHKKQVIARAQTALTSTQAALSDIYTSNDNKYSVDKRIRTRVNAGSSDGDNTEFTVWSVVSLYDEPEGDREATNAIVDEIGSYTVAMALYKDYESDYAAYDGVEWTLYDNEADALAYLSAAAAKNVSISKSDNAEVIHVWPFEKGDDYALMDPVAPKPDPDDPDPDPYVAKKSKRVILKRADKGRAFFAADENSAETQEEGLPVTFYQDDNGVITTDWAWTSTGNKNAFSKLMRNLILKIADTYMFRYWKEPGTGKICKDKNEIGAYIFDDANEDTLEFTFVANVIRDPNTKEQAIVSNSKLHDFIGGRNTTDVVMVVSDTFDTNGKTIIDDRSHPDYYIYAWYEGTTLKWWTNAKVAFMPEDCSGMLKKRDNLHKFSFRGFDVSRIQNCTQLFAECGRLNTIDWGDEFIAPDLTDMTEAFYSATGFSTLDMSGIIELGELVDLTKTFSATSKNTTFVFGDVFKNNSVGCLRETFENSGVISLSLPGWNVSGVKDCYATFNSCGNLSTVDLGQEGWNLSSCTTLNKTFKYCRKLTEIKGKITTTGALTNMRETFDENMALVSLDVSGIDPTNVENFRSCFKRNYALTTLDLSAWNGKPKKVKNMRQMFTQDSLLQEIDLSNWDLSNLVNMYSAFSYCGAATFNLTGWNTKELAPKGGKLITMGSAFLDCKSLEGTVDLSNWDTSGLKGQVEDESIVEEGHDWGKTEAAKAMFQGCTGINAVVLKNWDLTNVESLGDFFKGCTNIEYVDMSGLKADPNPQGVGDNIISFCVPNKDKLKSVSYNGTHLDNVSSVASMFYNCKQLEEANLKNFRAANATSASGMFNGCTMLTDIELDGMKMNNVTNASKMFMNCSSIVDFKVTGFEMKSIQTLNSLFESCTSLRSVDLSSFPLSTVQVISNMFKYCTGLVHTDLSGWDLSSVTDMRWMFLGCSNLESLDISEWKLSASGTADTSDMFKDCVKLETLKMQKWTTNLPLSKWILSRIKGNLKLLDMTDCDFTGGSDLNTMFSGATKLEKIILNGFKANDATTANALFSGCTSLETIEMKGMELNNVTNASLMFNGCVKLAVIDMSDVELKKVTNASQMFKGCTALKSFSGTGLQMGAVQDVSYMFENCSALITVDLSDIDLSSAENMSYMFRNCTAFVTQDLSGWDLSSAKSMKGMFEGCSNLEELDISKWKLAASGTIDTTDMFKTCDKFETLKMQEWTNDMAISKSIIAAGKAYVKTLDLSKCAFANRSNMSKLFQGYGKLENLVLTDFNTDGVTDMSSMFDECYNITSFDISAFNVSRVTTTAYMFRKCYSLTSVTFKEGGSNFEAIESMEGMFQDCISLSSAAENMSNIHTGDRLVNAKFVFKGCYSMQEISLKNFNLKSVTAMDGLFDMSGWAQNSSHTLSNGVTVVVDHKLTTIRLGEKCVEHSITNKDGVGSVFRGCPKLKTIYAYPGTDFRIVKKDYKPSTFQDSKAIVGGAGTAFKGATSQYAHIDKEGDKGEGYFTLDPEAGH